MEEYEGVRFRLREIDAEIPSDAVGRFLEVDSGLRRFLSPKQNEGNMSMRFEEGFLIKRTGARMGSLAVEDISWVRSAGEEVAFSGPVPSSESRMHARIYEACPDANVILHFHDEEKLKSYPGPSIGPLGYGTMELADAAGKRAIREKEFMIKGHGFVIIAGDAEELFQRLGSWKRS